MLYRRYRSKYNAVRTTIDGITFASKFEANCYLYLKKLMAGGYIKEFVGQKRYPVHINGIKVFTYILDFLVTLPDGTLMYIEAKGKMLPIAKLKLKAVNAYYGITVTVWHKLPSYPQLIHN